MIAFLCDGAGVGVGDGDDAGVDETSDSCETVVDEAESVIFVVKVTEAGPVNLGISPRQVV
jgi:hypothetical protein